MEAQADPGTYSWQLDHARMLPTGGIEWAPQPFEYQPGDEVRFIDFANGDDANDGRTHGTAWKHHPWDPNAAGQAARGSDADTFVFKRGVTYRGSLVAPDLGDNESTIQLTSDPEWGGADAQAVITGAERITGFKRGAGHPDIPDADRVWSVKLDFAPRNVWLDADGEIRRIPLARTPNWNVSDPDDIKSEWYHFDNPGNPHFKKTKVGGEQVHLAIDTENLTKDPEYYKDAYVWTEYGWVMSTPYPSRIVEYYPEKNAIAIEGQWGRGAGSYVIPRYSRYYLEDKPHYLDDPAGEFWFDRDADGSGTLYLRLPDGVDPNRAQIEVARHLNLIDIRRANHLRIAGLTFRFTNSYWHLDAVPGSNPDVDPAVIRLLGAGRDIEIAHNTFEHVNLPIRCVAVGKEERATIDGVVIRDNDVRYTDDGGFNLSQGNSWKEKDTRTRLLDVKILRNRLVEVAHRPTRFSQGHGVSISYAETVEVAGNILDRIYGGGILVYGGKHEAARMDRPLSRILIYQNQVTDPLLNTNDYGGVETWRGGPAFVFNNVSGNPGGFKYWGIRNSPKSPGSARFGHAYYMDGAFKQYYFNNIAWGKSNDPLSPLGNTAAFQEIHGFLANVFNNTAYNFVIGSRRQAPGAGQNKYMGNVWDSMGHMVFQHSKPSKAEADPNAAHAATSLSTIDHATNAYVDNLFYDPPTQIGVFESDGKWYGSVEAMRTALAARGSIGNLGHVAEQPPLRDPANHDFRPTAAAAERGVKVFVPWSVYGAVGEWHFYRTGNDSDTIPDESFHMAPYYLVPNEYHEIPKYPLKVVNAGDDAFGAGPLEDWTDGVLHLDGVGRYAMIDAEVLSTEPAPKPIQNRPYDWISFKAPATAAPGETVTVEMTLKDPPKGMKLRADVHWGKTGGAGAGMLQWGGDAFNVDGPGPYKRTIKLEGRPNLERYEFVVWLTPTGGWDDHTQVARYSIPKGTGQPEGGYHSPAIRDTNFLVEAFLRVEPGSAGIVAERMTDLAGYGLTIDDSGHLAFTMRSEGEARSIRSSGPIADGRWRHVLAEADRDAGVMRIYVDGTRDAEGPGLGAASLDNDAAFYVGGSPDGRHLKGDIDFLRVARGTLADAKTTIEELYTWQFDGPFLRDFTGQSIVGKRDAGAIEGRD